MLTGTSMRTRRQGMSEKVTRGLAQRLLRTPGLIVMQRGTPGLADWTITVLRDGTNEVLFTCRDSGTMRRRIFALEIEAAGAE